MASKNIITPWSFRDGRDYEVSLVVADNSSSFALKVTDQITAEIWSCTYDMKYIENLTQRTGNYKPFNVFMSMMKSAILKKSESVALEMMNLEDLEYLRAQRGPSSTIITQGAFGFKENSCEMTSSANETHFGHQEKCQSDNTKKKYLIVTYIAEFDRVHYPIPLNYSGPPDINVMQNSIKKLRSEVLALRHAKRALEEEITLLNGSANSLNILNPTPESSNASFALANSNKMASEQSQFQNGNREVDVDLTKSRHPEDEQFNSIRQLTLQVQRLEDRLSKASTDHQDVLDQLQTENDFLREKLDTSLKYEEGLENELFSLTDSNLHSFHKHLQHSRRNPLVSTLYKSTNTNAVGKSGDQNGNINPTGRDKLSSTSGEQLESCNYRNRAQNQTFSGGRRGNKSRTEQYVRTFRQRTADTYATRRLNKSPSVSPLPRQNASQLIRRCRSYSPSPRRPSFDPTAYIQEKRQNQQRMAQLRLDNIRTKLRARESSASSDSPDRTGRNRSRSTLQNMRLRNNEFYVRHCQRTSSISPRRSLGQIQMHNIPSKITSMEGIYREIERMGRVRKRSESRSSRRLSSPRIPKNQTKSSLLFNPTSPKDCGENVGRKTGLKNNMKSNENAVKQRLNWK